MWAQAGLNLVSGLIPELVNLLSPQMREFVEQGVQSWWEKASETENPWDNLAVALAAGVLGIKLKG